MHPNLYQERVEGQGLLPLFFHPDPEVCQEIVKALYKAGIRVIEFTNRGETALRNFSVLRRLRDQSMPDLALAVGTVKTAEQARQFLAEGADFLISPGMVPAVAEVAAAHGKWYVPGCMTPSEIIQAETLGATLVKLFPGHLLGPAFVTAIRDLFPHVAFMPTGGVEPEVVNLKAWFDAGVVGVGMGSKLISPAVLKARDFEGLSARTREVLQMIRQLRGA